MEWRAPRRDEKAGGAIELLDRPTNQRHPQLRSRRRERIGDEINRGADRAIIVVLFGVGLRRGQGLCGVRRRTGERYGRVGATNAVEMQVPERQDKLQRQRRQRQTTAEPPVAKPTHRA